MRRHPLFFAIFTLLAYRVQAIPVDSTMSGSWVDFRKIENRLELRTDYASGTPEIAAFATDRRSSDQDPLRIAGISCLIPNPRLTALIGPMINYGLYGSLRNPHGKAVATAALRNPSSVFLDANASPGGEIGYALSAGSVRGDPFGFRLTGVKGELDELIGTLALELNLQPRYLVRTEFLMAANELTERTADTWFSDDPPLPRRQYRLAALSSHALFPASSFFFDAALSDAFGQGVGGFIRAGGELSLRRWKLSLGTDLATWRFIDLDGEDTAPGIRFGLKLRRSGEKGASISLSADSAFETEFSRLENAHLSTAWIPSPKKPAAPISLSRIALSAQRNSDEENSYLDRYAIGMRSMVGSLSLELRAEAEAEAIAYYEFGGYSADARLSYPFRLSGGGSIDAALGGGIELRPGENARVSLSAKAGLTIKGADLIIRIETDDAYGWDRIIGREKSDSPLGAWSFSALWSIRERFDPRPF